MFRLYIIYGMALLVLILNGCTMEDPAENGVVASVGEQKLLMSDLAGMIPKGISKEDSMLMAGDYIKKWIKQELLIQKANENLTMEQKDLTREIREYRNSLIIYKYKDELMKQRMDTIVTDEEVQAYYDAHPDNFNLNRNIVQAIYVKIPQEIADPEMVRDLTANALEGDLPSLQEYCLRYASGFDHFLEEWIDFEQLKKNVPAEIEDDQRFLEQNNRIELNDSLFYYLVRIKDYRLVNDKAPIQFVDDNIRGLILNQRKIEFLKEIEENVYLEGVRQNKFRIYNDETTITNYDTNKHN